MTFAPLSSYLADPIWLQFGPGVSLWPIGILQRENREGILVLQISAAGVGLQCLPAHEQCQPSEHEWPRADAMGGLHQTAIRRALALGKASIDGLEMDIIYRKDGAPLTPRRIGRIVPSNDGAGVVCADIDKEQPRHFKLERIVSWSIREVG